jgi:hypothetical protein
VLNYIRALFFELRKQCSMWLLKTTLGPFAYLLLFSFQGSFITHCTKQCVMRFKFRDKVDTLVYHIDLVNSKCMLFLPSMN